MPATCCLCCRRGRRGRTKGGHELDHHLDDVNGTGGLSSRTAFEVVPRPGDGGDGADGRYRRTMVPDDVAPEASLTVPPQSPPEKRHRPVVKAKAAAPIPTIKVDSPQLQRQQQPKNDAPEAVKEPPSEPAVRTAGGGTQNGTVAAVAPSAAATVDLDVEVRRPVAAKKLHATPAAPEPAVKSAVAIRHESMPAPRSHKHNHSEDQLPKRQSQVLTPSAAWVKVREPHQHQHGFSVFQSDANEVTIVDSDYSDYESDDERLANGGDGKLPEFGQRDVATLSIVAPRRSGGDDKLGDSSDRASRKAAERLSAYLLAADADEADDGFFGWQSVPSVARPPLQRQQELMAEDEEEEVIVPADFSAVIPTPAAADVAASLSPNAGLEDNPAARASLLALDEALAVYELQQPAPPPLASGGFVASSFGPHGSHDGEHGDGEEVIVLASGGCNDH